MVQDLHGTIDGLRIAGEHLSIQEPRVKFGLGGISGIREASPQQTQLQKARLKKLVTTENWQDLTEKTRPLLQVETNQRRLDLRRLVWASPKATLDGDYLIDDWQQAATSSSWALRGAVDAAFLGDLAKAWGLMPADLAIKGRAQADWRVHTATNQQRIQEVSLQLPSFQLLRGKKIIASDPLLTGTMRVQYLGTQPQEIQIANFRLETTPLALVGSGLLNTDTPALELHGQFNPRSAQFVHLLHAALGRGMAFNSNQPGNFRCFLPFTSPLQWERLSVLAELPVDNLQFLGINLGTMTLPLEWHRNKPS